MELSEQFTSWLEIDIAEKCLLSSSDEKPFKDSLGQEATQGYEVPARCYDFGEPQTIDFEETLIEPHQ